MPPKAKSTKKAPASVATIQLPELKLCEMRVEIVGVTPLVQHRQGAKMARAMLGKQQEPGVRAKTKREPKNPVRDFLDTPYRMNKFEEIEAVDEDLELVENWTTDSGDLEEGLLPVWARFKNEDENEGWALPAPAIREGMIRAAKVHTEAKMIDLRTILSVPCAMFPLAGAPQMRFDFAQVQRSADLRFRAQFTDWRAAIRIQYNPAAIDNASVLNLLRAAGLFVGIGEMRNEKKKGGFGIFSIDPDTVSVIEL